MKKKQKKERKKKKRMKRRTNGLEKEKKFCKHEKVELEDTNDSWRTSDDSVKNEEVGRWNRVRGELERFVGCRMGGGM